MYKGDISIQFINFSNDILNLNLKSLMVNCQTDNPSLGTVTVGN